jgi:protein involved in polysaccharide export with SLBB domain
MAIATSASLEARLTRRPVSARTIVAVCMVCWALGGCASLTNPVAEGVPAHLVSPDYLGRPREELRTIPLTYLRQKPPEVYRLAAGDVLGVYIEGVLGDRNQPPPVRFTEQGNVPPAFGFPIPVDAEGKLPLPLIKPLSVKGMSIPEAQAAVVKAYTTGDKPILEPGKERIVVTLIRQRQIHVLVVRQDSGGITIGATGVLGSTKRGTGASIDLPAYENDVLNALTRTGGLPGLDAMNEVIIERGAAPADGSVPTAPAAPKATGGSADRGSVVRIPLRMRPGEQPPFKPEDVVLESGDIVFIEARDTELFYTGGLLPPRQFVLPRDYDLRVVDAIALSAGALVNGGFNQNNTFSGTIQASGLGSPSPSLVSIIRRTKGYGQLVIRVDLNLALRDQRENILIQAGDVIILQETPLESFIRYLNTVWRFNFLGTFIDQKDLQGNSTLNIF